MNSEEVASMLGVNVSSVKRWTEQGKLPCFKTAGGHRKFLLADVAEFLASHKDKRPHVQIFPIESEEDLQISLAILKHNFDYLMDYILGQALASRRERVQQVLNGMYLNGHGLPEIYDAVVTPVLHTIGDLWEQGEITAVEEHLASNAIRDCLVRLQGIVRIPTEKIGQVICLNPSGEMHDIALKMVDHILEARGYIVLFSGAMTPITQLQKVGAWVGVKRIYISATVVENAGRLEEELRTLCNLAQQMDRQVYLGGRAFDRIAFTHPAVVQRLSTFAEVAVV